MLLPLLALGAAIGSTYINAKQGREQLKQQKKEYAESKAQAEAELAKQKKKAKDLSDTYKGMKTNLYSAKDETGAGIASSNLIQ